MSVIIRRQLSLLQSSNTTEAGNPLENSSAMRGGKFLLQPAWSALQTFVCSTDRPLSKERRAAKTALP